MIPIEPLGVTLGVCGLYSICRDMFKWIERDANMEADLSRLVLKLDLDSSRLKKWSAKNHIVYGTNEPRWFRHANQEELNLAKQTLFALKQLYVNADKFRRRYGLREVSSMYTPGIVLRLPVRKRARWAVVDASRFGKVVNEVHDMIDRLVDIDVFQGLRRWRVLASLGATVHRASSFAKIVPRKEQTAKGITDKEAVSLILMNEDTSLGEKETRKRRNRQTH